MVLLTFQFDLLLAAINFHASGWVSFQFRACFRAPIRAVRNVGFSLSDPLGRPILFCSGPLRIVGPRQWFVYVQNIKQPSFIWSVSLKNRVLLIPFAPCLSPKTKLIIIFVEGFRFIPATPVAPVQPLVIRDSPDNLTVRGQKIVTTDGC